MMIDIIVAEQIAAAIKEVKLEIIKDLEELSKQPMRFEMVGEYDYRMVSDEHGEYIKFDDFAKIIEELKIKHEVL